MQVALAVTDGGGLQQSNTSATGGDVQQTQNSEVLGVHSAEPTASPDSSALALLSREAAGTTYDLPKTQSLGSRLLFDAGITVAATIAFALLFTAARRLAWAKNDKT